ncbi:MAG: MOSC domain-containing protein [Pseudomonadota bacterium]|nr:MOSC domain-containing protein [Pseudomonadota bacterium]
MSPTAHVEAIFLFPVKGGAPVRHPSACAVAGRGLDGDHHQSPATLFGIDHEPENQLTLIRAEALEALARDQGRPLPPGASRRNLVTRGVDLNALVGRTFRIGAVRARGCERCDPCSHLEDLTRPGVLRGLVDRGGLRAEILSDGEIHEGDPIVVE